MTVGLEPVCCAGAGTADANTRKNKGRTLTSLLFIRTPCFEQLPNSPRLLRTTPPSYCPLGRACTVLWARLRIQSTHESGWLEAEVGQKKLHLTQLFQVSEEISTPGYRCTRTSDVRAPGMIPGGMSATRKLIWRPRRCRKRQACPNGWSRYGVQPFRETDSLNRTRSTRR